MNDITHLVHWHGHVQTATGNFGLFQCLHARNAARTILDTLTSGLRETYYARRLCISVMAGIVLALENGFQRMIINHQPETVSPKYRGELSSSLVRA